MYGLTEMMIRQTARIAELEADLAQSEICIRARMDVIDQQAARILELEGMLDARSKEIVGRIQECQACQIDQLQADGKIGPDADAKPRVWQITEERIEALEYMYEWCFCTEKLQCCEKYPEYILQDMLKEVE